MGDLTGVLVEVTEAQDSSTLIADVSIGGLLLPLQNADDFPEPWVELGTGKVWRDTDIATWAESHGRKVHDWRS